MYSVCRPRLSIFGFQFYLLLSASLDFNLFGNHEETSFDESIVYVIAFCSVNVRCDKLNVNTLFAMINWNIEWKTYCIVNKKLKKCKHYFLLFRSNCLDISANIIDPATEALNDSTLELSHSLQPRHR